LCHLLATNNVESIFWISILEIRLCQKLPIFGPVYDRIFQGVTHYFLTSPLWDDSIYYIKLNRMVYWFRKPFIIWNVYNPHEVPNSHFKPQFEEISNEFAPNLLVVNIYLRNKVNRWGILIMIWILSNIWRPAWIDEYEQ